MTSPLVIIQARYASTRLPAKMLETLGDETLIARAHRMAVEAFLEANVVVAIPAEDSAGPLGDELRRIGATIFAWNGPESDVLSRFVACAHTYRWRPESVIVRYTPDDPWKDVAAMRRVAEGTREPVELGCEAFTLAMLDEADRRWKPDPMVDGIPSVREHITHALFDYPPPPAPPGRTWTIDTAADLTAARKELAGRVNTGTKRGLAPDRPGSRPIPRKERA